MIRWWFSFLLLSLLGQQPLYQVQAQASYEFYQQLAANLESTPEEFVELGGVVDDNCTFAFNATAENCEALIAAYEAGSGSVSQGENGGTTIVVIGEEGGASNTGSCGCYNFCRGQNVGCYDVGEFPPEFQCNIMDVVAGCQKGGEGKKSPLSPAEGAAVPCPPGYMCSQDKNRSCEEIRQIPIDLGLGDVHAGLYCPGTEDRTTNNYLNCESGYYCPNSTSKIPCPAGFFCPHKTSIPEIPCDFCEEGTHTMKRKPEGYIVVGVLVALIGVLVIWEVFKRYNHQLFENLVELKSRKVSNMKKKMWKKRRQAKLEQLQPKLEVIEHRLQHQHGSYQPAADEKSQLKALNTHTDDGEIVFNARKLFDLMDSEKKGILTFTEINHALELNAVQLREFSKRMNQAAKLPPETETVTRKVFSHYFLRVLEQISHFEPTSEEADQLYDDILEQRGEPIDLDGIPHECLYTSPLADFLNDTQINELIKRFRQLQEKQVMVDNMMGADGGDSGEMDNSANSRNSITPNFFHRLSTIVKRRSSGSGRRSVAARSSTARSRASTAGSRNSTAGRESMADPGSKESTLDGRHSTGEGSRQSTIATREQPMVEKMAETFMGHRNKGTVARTVRRASIAADVNDDELANVEPENILEFNRNKWKRPATFFTLQFSEITRAEFVAWYPSLLMEVVDEDNKRTSLQAADRGGGVDIAFQNLCLTVSVKKSTITIVDHVTGRLRSGTMTALMGGSGAGKTSLLNALCGRAHYGDVTGTVYINGHKASIEEHSSAVGFVPQDDIVYAELTVRENLIFAGKFMLPQGTPISEIEDLADSTMASLGLSRVMHSLVGDTTRRGVSGGEKKRVNIGLELMSKPKIIFLDEPTSGLDSNSALLVMSSLKSLCLEQGTTICAVIHQPRKTIFELFDSMVLLGVGGKLVFHGSVPDAERYFKKLNYDLPPGEALADWLIDISSGRLEPKTEDEEMGSTEMTVRTTPDSSEVMSPESTNLFKQKSRLIDPHFDSQESVSLIADSSAVEFENDAARAKSRREILYRHWKDHFKGLNDKQKVIYNAPDAFDLPKKREMKPFINQLAYQIHRLFIVGGRNWLVKVIDSAIIIGATVLIAIMDGTVSATGEDDLNDLRYESIAEPTSVEVLVTEFPKLFRYAITANLINLQGHASKLGVIIAVLVGLSATKVITSKRKEFFREAGSGYNVNAYFFAVNIVATLEHSIQILLCALCALWLRSSLSIGWSYVAHYLMLGWLTVSWALLFPLLVPQENVVLVTGFFIVIMSFLFSGANAPVRFSTIYNNPAMGVISGILSPCRFFIEALVVVESRALPVQSGFTDFGPNFRGDILQTASFQITGHGWHDFGTITQRSFRGWYWGVLPSLVVGLLIRWVGVGSIHVSDRAKQAKKSLSHTLKKEPSGWVFVILYSLILVGLLVAASYLILREVSSLDG